MGYSAKASSIQTCAQNIKSAANDIKGISFGDVWTGDNYVNFNDSLLQISTRISTIADSLTNYANGLKKLQKYKDNAEKIKDLNSQIQTFQNRINANPKGGLVSSYKGQIASLRQELNKLIEENKSLKNEIKGAMSASGDGGSSSSTGVLALSKESTVYVDNMINEYSFNELNYLYDLEEKYDSGKLKSTNLYNAIDQNYIEDGLKYIQSKYSQREAAIYSGMFLMSVAADSGVKIPYVMDPSVDNSPYISTKKLVDGADCEVVTDWVVDKGREDGFTWKKKNNYKTVGQTITAGENAKNWENVLPGDLFTNSGHVGVILGNDPVNKTFICMEATMGNQHAVAVTNRTYEELIAGKYQIQDMSSVYASSKDQYTINNYDQYVNKNS